MFENPRRGRQARNLTTNAPKILDLKSSSEQIFFRKLSLGALEITCSFTISVRLSGIQFGMQSYMYRFVTKLDNCVPGV